MYSNRKFSVALLSVLSLILLCSPAFPATTTITATLAATTPTPTRTTTTPASDQNAILIRQPAYHHMSFYAFKPANAPSEYYVTFDGYYVYEGNRGVWYYASAENGGIRNTGYVVGQVIPSVVRLKRYNGTIPRNPALSVMASSQQQGQQGNVTAQIAGTASADTPAVRQSAPEWAGNPRFTAVGKWTHTVDRMGVISRQGIPIAWKGDYPEVVYAWTGLQWRQFSSGGVRRSMLATVRRELYDLTVHVNQVNRLHWTDEDTRLLAVYAKGWGYEWQGLIIPGKVY